MHNLSPYEVEHECVFPKRQISFQLDAPIKDNKHKSRFRLMKTTYKFRVYFSISSH